MRTFKYPFIARILYRWANIPITLLLLLYFVASLFALPHYWYFIFPVVINGGVIVMLNRYYLRTYRTFPFEIQIDNEKMICSDFLLGEKQVVINLYDIDKITGGIFSGHPLRPIVIHDGRQDITIGFYQHVKNFNQVLTVILSNVKQELYNELIQNAQKIRDEFLSGKKRKK